MGRVTFVRLATGWNLACSLLAVIGAFAILATSRTPVSAGVLTQDGNVISLSGTPHLWISEGGSLHWAGDTRALANRSVSWSSRVEVSLNELRQLAIGDPWLSTGLVKEGDRISLSKWESNASTPTLLHVQSIADVEIFGIGSNNYGRMVIEGADWERKTGFQLSSVLRGSLESAVPAATPSPTPVATAMVPPTPVREALPSPVATATVVPTRVPEALPLPAVAMPSRPNDSDLTVKITRVVDLLGWPRVTFEVCNQSRAYEARNIDVHFSIWDPRWSRVVPSPYSPSALVPYVAPFSCLIETERLRVLDSWSSVTVKTVYWTWRSTGVR